MFDQANELRRLVRRDAAASERGRPRRKLIAVAGGKGGVGTTTVAVNLAVEIARTGRRTVLVDADPDGGDVAALCGLEDRYTISDVAAGRRAACESLAEGPGGLYVLTGAWAVDNLSELPAAEQSRLLRELDSLADEGSVVVVDAGNGRTALARQLWEAAAKIVVVTTAELASVMDAYGSIKVLAPPGAAIHTLVNMAAGSLSAGSVQRRLAQACGRFLGIEVSWMGHLGHDPQIAQSNDQRRPLVLAVPESPSARLIRRTALALTSHWRDADRAPAPAARDASTLSMAGG